MDEAQKNTEFIEAATRELDRLMTDVSRSWVRHGVQPRTAEQDAALLEAKIDACHQDQAMLRKARMDLDAGDYEEAPVDEAQFLKQARKELNALIAEAWGPPAKRRKK